MSIEIERISTVEQFQQINILNHLIGFVLYEHIFCLNRKKNIINSLNAFENDWPQNLKNSHNLFLNLTAKHNEYVEGYIDDEWTQEAENCAFFGFDILEWTFHEESSYENTRIMASHIRKLFAILDRIQAKCGSNQSIVQCKTPSIILEWHALDKLMLFRIYSQRRINARTHTITTNGLKPSLSQSTASCD